MNRRQPTARQMEIWRARKKYPSASATARALGITHQTVFGALKVCELYGLRTSSDPATPHTPLGYLAGKVTQQIDYRQDPAGKIVTEWLRSAPEEQSIEEIAAYLEQRLPSAPPSISRQRGRLDEDIMLQIDLADVHFGQLSWGKETRGDDYDIGLTRQLITSTMGRIYQQSGTVQQSLLVLYGDNFHADFFSAITEKSRHALDTDTRYPKIIIAGVETYCTAIEIAMRHSRHTKVIVLYGNHDKQSSVHLQIILHTYFRQQTERVSIDMEPSKTRYHVWGVTAQNYHHGDGTKPERLAADVLRYVAENDISGVREFRSNQAHLHNEFRRDINGVVYECKPSLVAPDAYAAGANYAGRRAAIATAFHRRYGEVYRYTITPRALQALAAA